jgi:hypothetical protein
MIPEVLWLAFTGAVVFALWRATHGGRRRRRVGPGTSGTIYDFLNEDKRKAIEIIVEERAEARDPEHADGNLPELAPGRQSSGRAPGASR